MNIQGKVIRVLPTQTVGEKGFQKREIHVEIDSDSKYPQVIGLEAQGEKVGLLDGINPNDIASFEINLRGREWSGQYDVVKVFNTLSIWKVEVKVKATAPAPIEPAPAPSSTDSDLPF
jgi:hypothetical protein